jgi:phosphoserine phosphatase
VIVIFDIEGVLVDGEFLPEAARLVGKLEEVRDLTLKGISGEINWEQGLQKRVNLIRGLTYEECVAVADGLPLMNGAKEAARELKSMGYILVGVSGGFSLLARRVKEELNLDHVFSNDLVFHAGRMMGYGLLVNANKGKILENAFGEMLQKNEMVAVVDGANDLDLFDLVDLKIAFNAQPIVKELADVVIEEKDLRAVPRAIKANMELLQPGAAVKGRRPS